MVVILIDRIVDLFKIILLKGTLGQCEPDRIDLIDTVYLHAISVAKFTDVFDVIDAS